MIAAKNKGRRGKTGRRKPTQHRARQTVEAILDAVIRILKRQGIAAVTTNRIAETAGVSIGSLYQYFPHKRAIFAALHRRHLDQIDRVIQTTLLDHASSSLDQLVRALVDAMIDVHSHDPELFDLLATQVPHRADGSTDFSHRLCGAFRLALAARAGEMKRGRDLDISAFVVTNLVDALSHAVALRRPKGLSLATARREVVRAVLAYLRA
jgi:AcrR family transcriptional regulator